MNVGRTVLAGAAVVGGVVAGGMVMRNVMEGVGERRWDKAYEHRAQVRADNEQARNGAVSSPFPRTYTIDPRMQESDGMFNTIAVMMPLFGAGGAAALGVEQLSKVGPLGVATTLGAFGAAGMLAGGVVGGLWGNSSGVRAASEGYGIDVAAQAREAFDNFDRDQDGVITLRTAADGDDAALSEHLRRTGTDSNGAPTFLSALEDLTAADANGDSKVTADEVRARIASYDENGDGTITRSEAYDRNDGFPNDRLLLHIAPQGTLR